VNLLNVIHKYAAHRHYCEFERNKEFGPPWTPCTCGLDEIKKLVEDWELVELKDFQELDNFHHNNCPTASRIIKDNGRAASCLCGILDAATKVREEAIQVVLREVQEEVDRMQDEMDRIELKDDLNDE